MARKNNPKQTIENIISISAQLFLEKGYEKTSMQDIVNSLGMSKGAVTHHFNTKEDIFNAVMERQYTLTIDTVNQWLEELHGLTAKEKLICILKRNLTETMIQDTNSMVTNAIENPHIILGFAKIIMNGFAPIIANILREGIDDGSITTAYPDECAEVLLLLLNFWCDTDVLQGDLSAVRKRFQFLQHLLRQLGVDILGDDTMELIDDYYKK